MSVITNVKKENDRYVAEVWKVGGRRLAHTTLPKNATEAQAWDKASELAKKHQ